MVQEKTVKKETKVISDLEFENKLNEMENAVFALDGEALGKIAEELKTYSFKGKSLEEVIAKAERKIEMSDFFSAVDMIARWKENTEIGEI